MFTIIGLGEQGRAIFCFLINHTKEKILTVDFNEKPNFNNIFFDRERWKHVKVNKGYTKMLINRPSSLAENRNVVISCLSTEQNFEIADLCSKFGCDYMDLGGDINVTKEIKFRIECCKKNIFLPDCGLAPGLVSSFASTISKTHNISKLEIYCGGLPLFPKPPIGYIRTFNPEGLVKEYSGFVELRKNKKLEVSPALSGKQNIFIEQLGILEARRTSGSMSLTPQVSKIPDLEYRTLRYPGHYEWFEETTKNLSKQEKINWLDNVLQTVSPTNPDIIVLHMKYDYSLSWKTVSKVETYFWQYDVENEISAMAQATGYTTAAVAMMIHNDTIKNKGFASMDDIDFNLLKSIIELEKNQFSNSLFFQKTIDKKQ